MRRVVQTLEGMAALAIYGFVVVAAFALALAIPLSLIWIAINS